MIISIITSSKQDEQYCSQANANIQYHTNSS